MINSNWEPILNDPKLLYTFVEKMPKWIKRKMVFYEIPYWEDINIVYVVDPMHIFKKAIHVLWIHI